MRSKKEKVFIALYNIFGKHLPLSYRFKPAKKVRSFFARRILLYAGKNINIEKGAEFNSQVKIGDNSGIGVNCEVHGPVSIGNYVNMGPEVVIYTRNHAFINCDIPIQNQGYEEFKPVKIEDDVWIGRRVIILPGVNIGRGSVLGAGTVVAKDIPPYSIVVGNPGQVVRSRSKGK